MNSTEVGAGLALGAAVALNGAFLMQHAGASGARPVDPRRPLVTLAALLRSPLWSVGAVAGMAGWALHVAAMREAPLSVVQAFVAGGLALAVPMAAIGLRRRLAAVDLQAIALMAAALALLSIGLHESRALPGFSALALALWIAALAAAAAALAVRASGARRAPALGLAGGLLYGAADLALKAVTAQHDVARVAASPWLPTALLATAAAFFAFQRGLQSDRPLAVMTLMTAATNVSSIAGAFAVYGDPLGRTPPLAALHLLAFALVIAAAWRLAPVQAQLAAG